MIWTHLKRNRGIHIKKAIPKTFIIMAELGVLALSGCLEKQEPAQNTTVGGSNKSLDPTSQTSGIAAEPQSAEDWNNGGFAFSGQGKYDKAVQAFDKAIEINPRLAEAWNNNGIALYMQGKYDEAVHAFGNVTEIDPQYASAWNNKGAALNKLGRTAKANAAISKARELGYEG
jgi:lipoprotein NlpI